MEQLNIDQMENLVGGSDYCDHARLLLSGGGFQGDSDLYQLLIDSYEKHCQGHNQQL
jgi:hypothetical protein